VVLVGKRQEGREIDEHVIPVDPTTGEIIRAIEVQLAHGRYLPSTLYGDGHVSERIADGLARLSPYIQKRLHYIYEDSGKNAEELSNFRQAEGNWKRA
jgi:hypothetical protein